MFKHWPELTDTEVILCSVVFWGVVYMLFKIFRK